MSHLTESSINSLSEGDESNRVIQEAKLTQLSTSNDRNDTKGTERRESPRPQQDSAFFSQVYQSPDKQGPFQSSKPSVSQTKQICLRD